MYRQDCLGKGFQQSQPFLSTVEILNLQGQDITSQSYREICEDSKSNRCRAPRNLARRRSLSFSWRGWLSWGAHKGDEKKLWAIEELAVADFLKWLTGSCIYPPHGFPRKIRCQFLHGWPGSCKWRPTTSTCDLVFTLPVHLSTRQDGMYHDICTDR